MTASQSNRDRAGWLCRNAAAVCLGLATSLALGVPSAGSARGAEPVDDFEQICVDTLADMNRALEVAAARGYDMTGNPSSFDEFAKNIAREAVGLSRIENVEIRNFHSSDLGLRSNSGAVISLDGWRDGRLLAFETCVFYRFDEHPDITVTHISDAVAAMAERFDVTTVSDERPSPDDGNMTWEWGRFDDSPEEGFLSIVYQKSDAELRSFLSIGIVKVPE